MFWGSYISRVTSGTLLPTEEPVKQKIKEVFYIKKVRPRDLAGNLGTDCA